MSTKLNAEELAAKAYPSSTIISPTMAEGRQRIYAAAIREVAQPIADERDELREVAMQIVKDWMETEDGVRGSTIDKARAVLAKYPKQ